jgi:phosphoglycolate phosphatase
MAGTTVRDGGTVRAAFTGAIAAFNLPAPEFDDAMRYVRSTMGQSKIEVFRALSLAFERASQRGGDDGPLRKLRGASEERSEGDIALRAEATALRLNDAFEKAYEELVGQGRCTAIPGAEEAIGKLRARGLKTVFTTGFSRATADAVITALRWHSLTDAVLTPADAGRGRPAPDLNLTALLRTRASSVRSLVVVGDTESDAQAAVNAGAGLVVGVLTGGRSEQALRSAGAHEVLASIADLPALVEAAEHAASAA